ncbi:AI-2E family transporter [Tissierella creatinophila]|uniref:Pheromone autoinducer 2 transporter n=1 Tax=Tissierella creatinophila DSM 6911 TaxID=1123403 RepID=A0A1U7M5M4_TISCR|nr:AI-2E family transporter [Tissierella creatinophila]OLS02519.1 pheromone autoinducer 2 transporter [Tissierella creatinophila DSM 6911]
MKVKWNQRYNTIAVYSFLVLALSIVFYIIASEVNLFKVQVSRYLSVFSPIIIGFIMAYIFNFILEFYEGYILKHIFAKDHKKRDRILGIVLTYSTVLLLLYLFLNFIFPQLISSIMGLVNDIPKYVVEISNKIIEYGESIYINDEYYKLILGKWDEFVDYILTFATDLLPKIGNFTKVILSSIWNIVLGIIVSIYLLIDKEKFIALTRKVLFGTFSEENAKFMIKMGIRTDNIFGKFLSGKLLDSFIIGILTFIVLTVFKMPYVLLVSFIIGITNIIPFFGPFIGAIPSFFIIMFISPVKALWFLLIIFIIQQIDGNIIGPKILGDSLGISAFWIMFSLLVAGKLFGFIGLVIGVPLFVLFYSIIKDIIESRLNKKGLPIDTEEYYE